MLGCPKCYCNELLIRRRKGIEKVMIYLTGKRKYICMSCGDVFRAADRRRRPRVDEAVVSHAQRDAA
jgi:hypothetical protein